MKKIITALFAVGAVCLSAAEKGVLLDYTFSKNPGIKLHSNAKIEDNLLKMDGKSYATVPNSKNWHLTEKGLTMIITAKLKEYGIYKDYETRLAWDCLRMTVSTDTVCEWYDKYNCTDEHITTLVKKALKIVRGRDG